MPLFFFLNKNKKVKKLLHSVIFFIMHYISSQLDRVNKEKKTKKIENSLIFCYEKSESYFQLNETRICRYHF